ncbi:MAG: hypothetical protein OEX19_08055 [Gammaproteobacteria bacterium]|nr:hypothetical protein [Gammaproteobacteria bacterium]
MLRNYLILLLLLVSTQVQALSLGELTVHSKFAFPLEADIEIPSYSAKEMDDLTVRLAGKKVFEKAGVELSAVHRNLIFKVERRDSDGKAVIRVTTVQPVKELGISFFIEARWRGGNMIRAYDVLLTPAIEGVRDVVSTEAESSASGNAIDTRQVPMKASGRNQTETSAKAPVEYGPVKRGEILGVIARKMIPNRQYSLQQVMVGIFEQNKDAFSGANINQLEPGMTLRLESPESVRARTKNEAIGIIQQHASNWRNGSSMQRTVSEGATDLTPMPSKSVAGIFKIEEVDDSSLHILTPDSMNANKDGRIEPSEVTTLRQELSVTLQEAEALKKQNEMLKDKVGELERMVALRIAQLMPEGVSTIDLGEKTSIIDKSDRVFQDDLVTSSSDISLKEEEESYFTEIMGAILVLLGGTLFFVLYRQKYRAKMIHDGNEPLPIVEFLKSRFQKKNNKITLRI